MEKHLNPHPLLLPGITDLVFGHLKVTQLKQCRIVCKAWNTEASTILRKRKCPVHLTTAPQVKEFIQNNAAVGNISVKIGNAFRKNHPLIRAMLKQLGKSIVSLELRHTSWTSFVSLRKFLSQTVPNIEVLCLNLLPPVESFVHIPTWSHANPAHKLYSLKNLKTLRFDVDYTKYWTFGEQENLKPFLHHLLSGMPSLEIISCPKYPENFIETFQYEVQILFRESPNLRPLISVLTEPKGPSLPKLKHLDLPLKHWTNIMSLQERNYHLEALDWFIGLDVTRQEVQALLKQVSKTMKSLSMDLTTAGKFLRDVNYEPCDSFQCLHAYDKLESVHLRSFKGSVKVVLGIPTLKNLTLTKARNLEFAFDEVHFSGGVRHHPLRSLVIDQHNPKDAVDTVTLQRIGTVFPNLRKFDIRFLSDAALAIVYTNFKRLEELVIMDGIFHDEGVTGMSQQKMDAAALTKPGIPFNPIQERKLPFIGDLPNLKKLSLGSKHLTGNSAYFGLLECRSLVNLTVMGYGFSSLSLCAIADTLNLSSLTTIFCSKLTVDGAAYIRKRLPFAELRLNKLQPPLNGLDIYRLGLFQSGTVPARKRPVPQQTEVPTLAKLRRSARLKC